MGPHRAEAGGGKDFLSRGRWLVSIQHCLCQPSRFASCIDGVRTCSRMSGGVCRLPLSSASPMMFGGDETDSSTRPEKFVFCWGGGSPAGMWGWERDLLAGCPGSPLSSSVTVRSELMMLLGRRACWVWQWTELRRILPQEETHHVHRHLRWMLMLELSQG